MLVQKRVAPGDSSNGASVKKTRLSDREGEISFFMSSPAMNDNGMMKPDRGIHTMLEALDLIKSVFQEIEYANQQIRVAVKKAEDVASIISSCLSGAGFVLQQQQVERLANVKQNMDNFAYFSKTMGKSKEQSTTKMSFKIEGDE